MRILVTGATGFLGAPLVTKLLSEGHDPRILTRQAPKRVSKSVPYFIWAGSESGPVPAEALEGVEAVLHLAGESIGAWPWNAERKRRILESRVLGTKALVEAMSRCATPPLSFISASAIGFYGDGGQTECRESDVRGSGFLAAVVGAWEAEIFKAKELGIRTVAVRTGLVLGSAGANAGERNSKPAGALEKMVPIFRAGLGAVMGTGRQWWSWIHLDDSVGIFLHALCSAGLHGPVNACAPEPVTNREFSRALAAVLHRPLLFKAPAFALKLCLGDMADTVLKSQRADATKILESGYRFQFPSLDKALRKILV